MNYEPDFGTYKVIDGEYGSGYTTTEGYQVFSTEEDDEEKGITALRWRVLSIDEKKGKIELISEKTAQSSKTLYLTGVNGYNHSVDILNDLCETLYSKTIDGKKVATARSLNIEDINEKTTFDYNQYVLNGITYGYKKALSSYGNVNYRKYPALYEKETGYAPGGETYIGLGDSEGLDDGVITDEITEYNTVSGVIGDYDYSTGTSKKDVYITFSMYLYDQEACLNSNLGKNTAPEGLFALGENYWLASRCVYPQTSMPYYGVRYVYSNKVNGKTLLRGTSNISGNYGVRPVIYIESISSIGIDETKSNDTEIHWNISF